MQLKKPDWLKIKIQNNAHSNNVESILARLSLNTVCDEANCPNRMECFCNKTATFMILGKICTRNCSFCNVSKNACTQPVDDEEPAHVAQAVEALGLKHAVVTSVTRDDLPDGGAGHFSKVIEAIRKTTPRVTIEVLIPDFQGDDEALSKVIRAFPDVINHNLETIERLYPEVRPMASYARSLRLLQKVKEADPRIRTKSGIMVGLGETEAEVIQAMRHLRSAGCDFLTIGQYLAPSKSHHPVVQYIHPDVFEAYKREAEQMQFRHVASGPFVRSSYHAGEALES